MTYLSWTLSHKNETRSCIYRITATCLCVHPCTLTVRIVDTNTFFFHTVSFIQFTRYPAKVAFNVFLYWKHQMPSYGMAFQARMPEELFRVGKKNQ